MSGCSLNPFAPMEAFEYRAETATRREIIARQAAALEELGAFAIVLESVPANLAREISESLRIPTIGIGAGAGCDGQILVLQDLLGMNRDFRPKFARPFLAGERCVSGGPWQVLTRL